MFFYENAILFSSIDISRSYSKNKNLIIKLKKIPFPTQKNHYCIDYYLTYICWINNNIVDNGKYFEMLEYNINVIFNPGASAQKIIPKTKKTKLYLSTISTLPTATPAFNLCRFIPSILHPLWPPIANSPFSIKLVEELPCWQLWRE